jgi:hypothetical protein
MSDLDRLVRRLRSLPPSAWRSGGRDLVVRRLAADLVTVGGSGHELPDLPDHALADAIAVLGREAQQVDPDRTADLLRAALSELS